MRVSKISAFCILSLLCAPSIGYAADVASDPVVVLSDNSFEERWSWTGVTLGVEAGYSWQKDQTISPSFGQLANAKGEGDIYGIFIGYNHQFGSFVAGVEGSYENYSNKFTDGSGVVIEDMWSLKGRAGYSFDRVQVYGLAGIAYGNTSSPAPFLVGRDTGLIIGAGVDVAVTDKLFVGLQYNHLRFDDFANLDLSSFAPPGTGINAQMDTVKVRFGYKF